MIELYQYLTKKEIFSLLQQLNDSKARHSWNDEEERTGVHGGSFGHDADSCKVSHGPGNRKQESNSYIGFRLVRNITE